MAAITDYSSLATALADWAERTIDADQIIGLSEAEFRLYLGPNFAKQTAATLTVASGSAALPTGLVRVLGVTHATYGALHQTTIASVRERRIWDATGIPDEYAITGTTLETGPSYDGSLTLDYEGTLSGLTASNTTNWLVTNAPQAYLAMGRSMIEARAENYETAAAWRSAALQTLSDLGIQSNVAQFSRATVTIAGATP